MNGLAASLRALGPLRLAALGGVGLAVLGLLLFLSLRGGSQPMALLYGELEMRDAGAMGQALERARIPFRVGPNGNSIMVPAEDVPRARLLLAGQGLPSGGAAGYELFDRQDGLTVTGFQQNITQLRAMEGELARTIRSLSGVRAARVHLVLPRREPFQRDRQEAQASVVLTMNGSLRLDREQVQAVLHLVSSAVPGLSPRNVSIVDSRGELLARSGQAVGGMGLALNAEEIRRAQEARLSRGVEEMLERIVGPGRVRVEVAAEMDFDRVTENRESFDPDQQVARSVQSTTENSRTTEATNNVTAANNLPNAEGTSGQAGSQESRSEETTNFEIGRIVRQMVRDTPSIRRLSVAVLVDHAAERAEAGGSPAFRPRSSEELAQLANLVRSAVGFDERRGDAVQVVNMRFAGIDEPVAAESALVFGLIDRPNLIRLVETLVLGIVATLALLLVARPAITRILSAEGGGGVITGLSPAMAGAAGLLGPGGAAAAALGGPGAVAGVIAGPGGQLALAGPGAGPGAAPGGSAGPAGAEDESMIDMAQIEGQMRASSLRKVTELVAKHPEESLAILRGWMTQEN